MVLTLGLREVYDELSDVLLRLVVKRQRTVDQNCLGIIQSGRALYFFYLIIRLFDAFCDVCNFASDLFDRADDLVGWVFIYLSLKQCLLLL